MKKTTKFKIVFDTGKPYEVSCKNEEELRSELKKFYIENKGNDYQYDAKVFNDKNEDISESQSMSEMMADIIEEVGE